MRKSIPGKSNKPKFIIERPGRLVSDVQLHLNTVDAQTLFLGLQSKEAVGLLAFGGRHVRYLGCCQS